MKSTHQDDCACVFTLTGSVTPRRDLLSKHNNLTVRICSASVGVWISYHGFTVHQRVPSNCFVFLKGGGESWVRAGRGYILGLTLVAFTPQVPSRSGLLLGCWDAAVTSGDWSRHRRTTQSLWLGPGARSLRAQTGSLIGRRRCRWRASRYGLLSCRRRGAGPRWRSRRDVNGLVVLWLVAVVV